MNSFYFTVKCQTPGTCPTIGLGGATGPCTFLCNGDGTCNPGLKCCPHSGPGGCSGLACVQPVRTCKELKQLFY